MNGVRVQFTGWIDAQRLDGAAYMEMDNERAKVYYQTNETIANNLFSESFSTS